MAVELLLNLFANPIERGSSGFDVVGDAENDEALTGPDRLSEFAGLEREGLVFQLLGEIVALEVAEIARPARRWSRWTPCGRDRRTWRRT